MEAKTNTDPGRSMEGIVLSGEIRYNFSYQKTGKDCRMSVWCEPVYSKRVEDMGKDQPGGYVGTDKAHDFETELF